MTEATDRLDEQALRRSDFRGGEPIVLADGQAWHFPKPVIEFFPRFSSSGPVELASAATIDPAFDEAVGRYEEACRAHREDGASPSRWILAMMDLAATMLRANYALDDQALATLLRFRPDDEANCEAWAAITDVAKGISVEGKPDADGSA
jgi:hypothetical protein